MREAPAFRDMTPEFTTVPARDVLTVDGVGAPDDPAFTAAIRALYRVRAVLGAGTDVPLEGSYAQDGDQSRFDLDAPSGWHWRLLVPAPPDTTAEAVAAAAARVGAAVALRSPAAQPVAQVMHQGPYADEGPSLAALHTFVKDEGRTPVGPHTEVYLADPATVPPHALRTLLRVPVR